MKIKWNEYTWYSKLAAAIFFILILPTWTFYLGIQYQLTNYSLNSTDIISNSTSPATSVSLSSISVKIPFDKNDLFKDEKTFNFVSGIKNPRNGDILTFEEIPSYARNANYKIYINSQFVSGAGGQALSMYSFSPDNQYFAFKPRFVCGATCDWVSINVVDFSGLKTLDLMLPVRLQKGLINKEVRGQYQEINPFVESYTWSKDGGLDVIQYLIAIDKDGKYYQITPKEIWHYDLVTNQPTGLVKNF